MALSRMRHDDTSENIHRSSMKIQEQKENTDEEATVVAWKDCVLHHHKRTSVTLEARFHW